MLALQFGNGDEQRALESDTTRLNVKGNIYLYFTLQVLIKHSIGTWMTSGIILYRLLLVKAKIKTEYKNVLMKSLTSSLNFVSLWGRGIVSPTVIYYHSLPHPLSSLGNYLGVLNVEIQYIDILEK